MPTSLEGQVVLIVGASSGIGRATAMRFAREGARVMASARRLEKLRDLQRAAAPAGTIAVFAADAGSRADMDRLADETRRIFGDIDVLVYAAGTNTPDRALKRLTPEIWEDTMRVNLAGAYYITHAVLPRMRERGSGHLIYISSISGLVPDVSGAAYQAAKRGLVALAHAIRVEEKEHGIRTCAVCPGLVDTEILNRRPVKPSPETLAKALQPEDVAALIVAIAKLPPRVTIPEVQILPTVLD